MYYYMGSFSERGIVMLASDEAVFFADMIDNGWHLSSGRLFLCRRNGATWENALVNHVTNFPKSEVLDESEVGSISTILWVEPDDWLPLNLAPNQSPSDGLKLAKVMLASTRFRGQPDGLDLVDKMLRFCSGKTHREVYAGFHFS